MKKPLPELRTDEETEAFLATDMTDYDWSELKIVQFEFEPKSKSVNLRFSDKLLQAAKLTAAKAGIPYQKFIRQAVEAAIAARS
jgi:predicted DNA binding CopG/RHH family protein